MDSPIQDTMEVYLKTGPSIFPLQDLLLIMVLSD